MPSHVSDLITGAAGPPPEKDRILPDESTVIASCKQEGMRLYLRETDADQFVLETGQLERSDPSLGPLVRLWHAFTQHDIEYLSPRDPGISGRKSSWLVPDRVLSSLNVKLADDCSDVRRLSTWPITRCFVYVDVSDFSQHRPGQRALIIGSLVSMIRNWDYWNSAFASFAWKDLEAMLCIGDGYIFVLQDVAHATYFAAYLAQLIEVRVAPRLVPVEFHFRMGVHVGPVYCFWDWGRGGREGTGLVVERGGMLQRTEVGDWNYIGAGINGGQRVLAAIGKESDDVLFISGQARQALTEKDDGTSPVREILDSLLNRGRRADKHNKFWRVYEVNHGALCARVIPAAALC
jgi:hypothetical protein